MVSICETWWTHLNKTLDFDFLTDLSLRILGGHWKLLTCLLSYTGPVTNLPQYTDIDIPKLSLVTHWHVYIHVLYLKGQLRGALVQRKACGTSVTWTQETKKTFKNLQFLQIHKIIQVHECLSQYFQGKKCMDRIRQSKTSHSIPSGKQFSIKITGWYVGMASHIFLKSNLVHLFKHRFFTWVFNHLIRYYLPFFYSAFQHTLEFGACCAEQPICLVAWAPLPLPVCSSCKEEVCRRSKTYGRFYPTPLTFHPTPILRACGENGLYFFTFANLFHVRIGIPNKSKRFQRDPKGYEQPGPTDARCGWYWPAHWPVRDPFLINWCAKTCDIPNQLECFYCVVRIILRITIRLKKDKQLMFSVSQTSFIRIIGWWMPSWSRLTTLSICMSSSGNFSSACSQWVLNWPDQHSSRCLCQFELCRVNGLKTERGAVFRNQLPLELIDVQKISKEPNINILGDKNICPSCLFCFSTCDLTPRLPLRGKVEQSAVGLGNRPW